MRKYRKNILFNGKNCTKCIFARALVAIQKLTDSENINEKYKERIFNISQTNVYECILKCRRDDDGLLRELFAKNPSFFLLYKLLDGVARKFHSFGLKLDFHYTSCWSCWRASYHFIIIFSLLLCSYFNQQ